MVTINTPKHKCFKKNPGKVLSPVLSYDMTKYDILLFLNSLIFAFPRISTGMSCPLINFNMNVQLFVAIKDTSVAQRLPHIIHSRTAFCIYLHNTIVIMLNKYI